MDRLRKKDWISKTRFLANSLANKGVQKASLLLFAGFVMYLWLAYFLDWQMVHKLWINFETSRYSENLYVENSVLKQMYTEQYVVNKVGEKLPVGISHVDAMEGKLLYDLVYAYPEQRGPKTLEVGMAFGTTALFICQALNDRQIAGKDGGRMGHHVSIDPNQSEQWSGVGKLNLQKAGLFEKYAEVREEFSHAALPKALEKGEKYDLIFIDGAHAEEFVHVDVYFSSLLLDKGGYLVLDDCRVPGVAEVVKVIRERGKFKELPLHHLFGWSAYFRTCAFQLL